MAESRVVRAGVASARVAGLAPGGLAPVVNLDFAGRPATNRTDGVDSTRAFAGSVQYIVQVLSAAVLNTECRGVG